MISRKKWFVLGRATKIIARKNGQWVTIKGLLNNDSYKSELIIDCWVPNAINNSRRSFYKKFKARGVLVFEDNDSYFLTEELLI